MTLARANGLILVLLLACGGCDEADQNRQTESDRQECAESADDPVLAIGACTLLIYANDDRLMSKRSAYYNRALGFIELKEFGHARIDLKKVLSLKPDDRFAKETLEEISDK